MKTLQTITKSFLIAASLMVLASCNKDDAAPTPVSPVMPANASFITAKVDGADFSSFIFGTSTASCAHGGSGSDQFVNILAGDLAANSVTLFLSGDLAVGTYAVNSNTDGFLNYSPSDGSHAFSTGDCDAASGTITVTVSDAAHIEGTFSFVGRDTDDCSLTKTVTQGSFKGVYQSN